jgi:glycogen debranching enzyme
VTVAGQAAAEDRGEHEVRERAVLTKTQPSVVRSISDAVVIKDGEPFFLCPPDGQIPLDGAHGYGLFQHDTRFLQGYELRIDDLAMDSLVATAAAGTTASLELSNPEIQVGGGGTIGKNRLEIRWTRALDGGRAELNDTLAIRNHDADDVTLAIRIDLAASFRDVFEIRGLLKAPDGITHDPAWRGTSLVFANDGRDGVHRSLTASFHPSPAERRPDGVTFRTTVKGHDAAQVNVRLRIGEKVRRGAKPMERRSPVRAPSRPPWSERHTAGAGRWAGGEAWATSVRTNDLLFQAVIGRSLDDLDLLRGELDGRAYFEAGVPWFATLFGRDSMIAAFQVLAFDPRVAADTLRLLASRQGTRAAAWRDEEPGKILHELRVGALARLDEIPQTPYYGSVDSTPWFLLLLGEHARWSGTLDLFHELGDNVQRALEWIDQAGDADGCITYTSASDGGLANQGWKDSGDAIVDADGHVAKPPIALAEVQGYVYAAWRSMADLFERDGYPGRARHLRAKAEDLRRIFERDFWSDDLGCYVMALERDRRPCAVVASNAGQVLFSGIASKGRATKVQRRMLADDMFNGWGIRTMSTAAAAYNPIGYHLGTVWPHDNSLIAAGFRRYGLDDAAVRILGSMVEASGDFEHQRLPECFTGLERSTFDIPVRYPVACHPQAWAAGAVPYLLTTTLGLEPEGFDRRLRIVRPALPSFVDRLELRGLPVADARVDLEFERGPDATNVTVNRVDGELDVVVEQGPYRYVRGA